MQISRRNLARYLPTAAVAALGSLTLFPTVAGAAFPVSNGDIAFVTTRGNNVNVLQVNPNGSGVGTASGDTANTTALTGGSLDAEPFYSPDGTQVVFASNRTGRWAIFSIAQSDTNESTPAVELSQDPNNQLHDDYAPSFGVDGKTVVFNRDNTGIFTLYTPSGLSSVCNLYNPPDGLAAAGTDGAASRIVFDPVDASKAVYVSGKNQIHLLTGVQAPTAATPCPTQSGLTDVNLSVTATAPAGGALGTQADANPDWSPDGTKIVFDSTRGGGHTLWYLSGPTTGSPSVAPAWSSQAAPNMTTDTQPVFSPDGLRIAYTQPVTRNGTQVIDYELNTVGMGVNQATDLTLGAGASANSQPDWQPLPLPANAPESPSSLLLPGSALLIGGSYALVLRRRRRGTAS